MSLSASTREVVRELDTSSLPIGSTFAVPHGYFGEVGQLPERLPGEGVGGARGKWHHVDRASVASATSWQAPATSPHLVQGVAGQPATTRSVSVFQAPAAKASVSTVTGYKAATRYVYHEPVYIDETSGAVGARSLAQALGTSAEGAAPLGASAPAPASAAPTQPVATMRLLSVPQQQPAATNAFLPMPQTHPLGSIVPAPSSLPSIPACVAAFGARALAGSAAPLGSAASVGSAMPIGSRGGVPGPHQIMA